MPPTRTDRSSRRVRTVIMAPLAAAAMLTASGQLAAQEAAAPELRTGQWGAQFIASSGFGGAGLLRFRSPTSAWTMDGTVNVATNSSSSGVVSGTTLDQTALSARLGIRSYGEAHGPVRVFRGGGVHLGYLSSTMSTPPVIGLERGRQKRNTYAVGGFGELGASYFITPHLALGASGTATLSYEHSRTDLGAQHDDTNGMSLAIGPARLLVTLFF